MGVVIETGRLKIVPFEMGRLEEYVSAFDGEITKYQYPDPFASVAAAQETLQGFMDLMHRNEMLFLSSLGELVPPEAAAAVENDPSAEIKAALDAQALQEEQERQQAATRRVVAVGPDDDVPPMPEGMLPMGEAQEEGEGRPLTPQEEFELDPDATRRYTDLQFGKDYQIQ